jgi:hypothetical protein
MNTLMNTNLSSPCYCAHSSDSVSCFIGLIRSCRDEGRHGCGFDPEQDSLFAVHGPVPPLVRNPLAAAVGEPQLGGRQGSRAGWDRNRV